MGSFINAGRVIVMGALLTLVCFPSVAGDSVTVPAREINVSGSKVTLFAHEARLFGMTCVSGPVGELKGLKTIRIGDTINHGKYSFRVGVIQATLFYKDLVVGGEEFARAGETVCVVAANQGALPSEDDCDALWLRIRNCRKFN